MMKIEDRWVGNTIVFKDDLKSGDGTEIIIESVDFDIDIPEFLFTKAALRK